MDNAVNDYSATKSPTTSSYGSLSINQGGSSSVNPISFIVGFTGSGSLTGLCRRGLASGGSGGRPGG